MIPEPFRSRLMKAVGNPAEIDSIHIAAMQAHPRLFRPFRCAECVIGSKTESGHILCRGMTLSAENTAYCGAFKQRRFS